MQDNLNSLEWRDVPGFEKYYMVSSTGLVYSKRSGKLRKLVANPQTGYLTVVLCGDCKKTLTVHRIVAEAFLEKPIGCDFVNHKDENKHNNDLTNLEWCTKQYNNVYGSKLECYYRPIIQIDPQTGEETQWKSCIFPEKAGIANHKNISACCRGLRNKAGGYEWRYA